MIPAVSAPAYDAARHRSAFLDRSHRGRIVVSGTERASYLQGLFTNDLVALKAGQGCYTAYLTAQGRMIADLYAYELGDVLLLTMTGGVKDAVMAKLDQFIFSEDVQLGDVTGTFAQIAIVGPDAAHVVGALVSGVDVDALREMTDHGNARGEWAGGAVIVTRVTDTGEPGFDLFVEHAQAGALKTALLAAGAVELDEATAEAVRIESGVPLFGRDMDEETIPLEAGIESRAISFSKGCYVGQEVIIRVMHRGHGRVARKLVGLVLDGDQVPAAGAVIRGGEREIGRVTSSTASLALQRPIALAYVHRDFLEPGTVVTVGEQSAVVTALPFVAPRSWRA
ncbi:MAG TPA: aminomethyltransferase family protein [Vicinamibacterales bacterium]|nr:aminomethyltransferase family protein [Vicinamibacterales bacterium]